MKDRKYLGITVACLVLSPYVAMAVPQDRVDLKQMLKLKQTLNVRELNDQFTAIRIGSESQISAMSPFMYMGVGTMSGSQQDQANKMLYMDARWSKGDVVQFDGKRFLVTYRANVLESMLAMSGEFDMDTNLVLRLDLVSMESIKTIAPIAELTAKKFKEMFAADTRRESPRRVSNPAPQTNALSNVKQLSLGMLMYAADYDDMTPYAQATQAVKYVTMPYIKNNKIWETGNPAGSRFYFNMAVAGVNMTDIEDPAMTLLFYESRAWVDGRRIVSFCDGHAKILSENEWQKVKLSMKFKIKKSAKPLPPEYGVKRDANGHPIPPSA